MLTLYGSQVYTRPDIDKLLATYQHSVVVTKLPELSKARTDTVYWLLTEDPSTKVSLGWMNPDDPDEEYTSIKTGAHTVEVTETTKYSRPFIVSDKKWVTFKQYDVSDATESAVADIVNKMTITSINGSAVAGDLNSDTAEAAGLLLSEEDVESIVAENW